MTKLWTSWHGVLGILMAAVVAAGVSAGAAEAAASEQSSAQAPTKAVIEKTIGIVLFDGFEVLDVYGPLEFWGHVPEFEIVTIAEQAGPVRSGQGVATVAEYSFATAPPVDILMVPGGMGTRSEVNNENLLNFLRERNQKTELTTSVCTGSALLAKAGLLDGVKATSNKRAFSFAMDQSSRTDWVGKARWVEDGKFITSSGVSAGADMALGLVAKLYGHERAAGLAKSLEYVWNSDATNDPFAIELPHH
jgi:putative intracellular protease/amidase